MRRSRTQRNPADTSNRAVTCGNTPPKGAVLDAHPRPPRSLGGAGRRPLTCPDLVHDWPTGTVNGPRNRILVLEVVASISQVRRKLRRIESQERRLLENFGSQLFQAVFSGPIRDCLERSRVAAETKSAGLRIRLRLPGVLANIPWEYLYDAEYGFLGLSPETALVRYLEIPTAVRPFPISPPLRVLAMISAPSDVRELQGEEEWSKLNEALQGLLSQRMVQVDRIEAGSLSALQRPLALNQYHVLHFVGHGVYDESAQDGALALEGADRRTRLVTGRDLGQMIRGHRSLRLVVLNACEGARSASDDPFGGVAQALVRQGIPAVIAMQFEISDLAALVFSRSFYQAIADGLPVDLATVAARVAMFAAGHEVEWATPVLYLRSPDGRVFTKSRIARAEHDVRQEAERRAGKESQHKAEETIERSPGPQTKAAEKTVGARNSGDVDQALRAEVELGALLAEQDDMAGARAAYQKAIDSGHAEYAPAAEVGLGRLLAVHGDAAGARAAYKRAIKSGHPGHSARAVECSRFSGHRIRLPIG